MNILIRVALITFCLSWCFCSALQAQCTQYTFKTIGQNLPKFRIHAVARDEPGYLWLGTQTGLWRYDGSTCRDFTSQLTFTDISDLSRVGPWLLVQDIRQLNVFDLQGETLMYASPDSMIYRGHHHNDRRLVLRFTTVLGRSQFFLLQPDFSLKPILQKT